jgi:hypothetical protein
MYLPLKLFARVEVTCYVPGPFKWYFESSVFGSFFFLLLLLKITVKMNKLTVIGRSPNAHLCQPNVKKCRTWIFPLSRGIGPNWTNEIDKVLKTVIRNFFTNFFYLCGNYKIILTFQVYAKVHLPCKIYTFVRTRIPQCDSRLFIWKIKS